MVHDSVGHTGEPQQLNGIQSHNFLRIYSRSNRLLSYGRILDRARCYTP